MADAADSKSVARKGVWVQVPPPAVQVRHGSHDLNKQASRAEVCTPPHADRRLVPRSSRLPEASGWNRQPIAEQWAATPVSVASITIADAFPHLVTMDWRTDVRLKSQSHPAGRDLQDRDHDRRLEILTATDHHTFTTLPS